MDLNDALGGDEGDKPLSGQGRHDEYLGAAQAKTTRQFPVFVLTRED